MLKVLIIGYVWPEPNSSAAGVRMMELIRLFLEQNWSITYASPAATSEHMEDLDADWESANDPLQSMRAASMLLSAS